MTRAERLNELYKEYELEAEDVFAHKHYKIITRAGIDKIQAKANIDISYTLDFIHPELKHIIVKAIGTDKDGRTVSSYGECSTGSQLLIQKGTRDHGVVINNTNAYPVAMAEKRAMSRVVLKLTGFYAEGVFGEEEAEDFKKS